MARGAGWIWNLNRRRRSAAHEAGEIPRWNVNRRRRSAAHYHCGLTLSSVDATGQKQIQKPPFRTTLKYMFPSILGLAALKYQTKSNGLFDVNPVPPWCFLGATCGYCLILEAKEQMQYRNENDIRFQILNRSAFAFGLLSIVSLLSIFVPHLFSIVPLITLATLPAVVAWPQLVPAFNWLCTSAFHSIGEKVAGRARRISFTKEASLPK